MEKIIEALLLYCEARDNATAVLRNSLKNIYTPESHEESQGVLPESRFSEQKWRDENGAKLKDYSICLPQDQTDKTEWQNLYDFLYNQGARINKRFHEEHYVYSYWLYPEKYDYKIFRQIKKKES